MTRSRLGKRVLSLYLRWSANRIVGARKMKRLKDLMNTKGLDRAAAAAEAAEIYQQKTGKTIAEMKDERYSELLVLYEKELGVVNEAIEAADAQIKKEFGTGMFLTPETPEEEPEVSRA